MAARADRRELTRCVTGSVADRGRRLRCAGPGVMLQRRTEGDTMREMTVRESNQNFSQVVAAAERGETIVITKNGVAVAKITPQPADRARDPNGGLRSQLSRRACNQNGEPAIA